MKKVFLEISQNSQENTCARGSLLKKTTASARFGYGTKILRYLTEIFNPVEHFKT